MYTSIHVCAMDFIGLFIVDDDHNSKNAKACIDEDLKIEMCTCAVCCE